MPASNPPIHPHPSKPFRRMKDAADAGQLIMVRCNLCSRCSYFLAADLATVLDPQHPVHQPPFPCSKCGKYEYIDIKALSPRPGDYGNLPVRRPGEVITVQKWRTVILGDP